MSKSTQSKPDQIDWREWQKRLGNFQRWRQRQARRQTTQEAEYDRRSHREWAVAEEFFQWCAPKGRRILDIGCGGGWHRRLVKNFDYIGVDPLIVSPRELFPLIKGVGEHLPFRDGMFDCVVITAALDHVASIHHTFSESRRVLKSGGLFCLLTGAEDEIAAPDRLTTAQPTSQASFWSRFTTKFRTEGFRGLLNSVYYHVYYSNRVKDLLNNTHVRSISLAELRGELSRLGFTVESVQSQHDQVFFLKACRYQE